MMAELPGKCTDPMQLRQNFASGRSLLLLAPECAGLPTLRLRSWRRTYFGASKGVGMWDVFCFVLRSSLWAKG
jgi:hypothetical protein